MKKWLKTVLPILLISMLFASSVCFADASDVVGDIKEKGNQLLSAFLWFGYAISLGMVIFIGIKYILGAAEARANMKGAIVNWLIGAFIVFMCTTIAGWVVNVVGQNEPGAIVGAVESGVGD